LHQHISFIFPCDAEGAEAKLIAAIATKYMDPLEMAAKELNPIKRLAYVACYSAI
jgi:hypothetical protein